MNFRDNFKQAAKELMSSLPDEEQEGAQVDVEEEDWRESPEISTVGEIVTVQSPMRLPLATVIAAEDSVRGNLRCSGGMELYGEVLGDIHSGGDMRLSGRLEGNATGQNMDIRSGLVKGDLNSSGAVQIDGSSVVLGNVRAEMLSLNGKIKGNLDVEGALVVEANGVVSGRINAGRITVQEGAIILGEVNIRSVDYRDLFPDEEDLFGRPTRRTPPPGDGGYYQEAVRPQAPSQPAQQSVQQPAQQPVQSPVAPPVQPAAPATPVAPAAPAAPEGGEAAPQKTVTPYNFGRANSDGTPEGQNTNPFVRQPQGGGQTPPTNPFGGNQGGQGVPPANPFGGNQPQSPYGGGQGVPPANPFGGQPQNPYGQQPQNPYGQQPPGGRGPGSQD